MMPTPVPRVQGSWDLAAKVELLDRWATSRLTQFKPWFFTAAVLLGAIPMQDMDLVLRPQLQSVDVNPESPNIPLSVAKGLQQG